MMWLLTAWGGVKRAFRLALAYPLQAAIIALLCLSVWLYWSKQGALDTVADRNATIAQMEQASKDAKAAQIALNKQVTDKQTQIAKDADNAKNDIVERGNRAAARMRAKDYCLKASATATSGAAESDHNASNTAVVLNRRDYDILVGNTARLVEVKAWGDRLIGEGLAVPVE